MSIEGMLEVIQWLGHASFRIKSTKTIYLDPWQLGQLEQGETADIILVTHEHRDHLSKTDIDKLSSDKTTVVTGASCAAKLEPATRIHIVKAGDRITIDGIVIEVIPAYNLNKFRSPGVLFHPQELGGVGYILTVDGIRIYHAGDTDLTDEMKNVKTDIALLPVSGRAVMTADEAAEAVGCLKPSIAIPMHYGSIMGSIEDAEKFKEIAPTRVEILEKAL